MVSSANSMRLPVEKIAGSEKDFVDKMRAKLLEWGIQDAAIVNTTGLKIMRPLAIISILVLKRR